ncbi:MAG: patatin-like phospholipase family protein [Saprospiraceae bacterium]|nr:patatin-like phospholipase family protein [Saprospiraceae bacterium]
MAISSLHLRLTAPGPKRILALDGGGVRGVLTLGYLERMEAILRKRHANPDLRLSDYFDLIGGTSTGSIIAAGLALGMSASEIKEQYLQLGETIFAKKKGVIPYLTKGVKYDSSPMDKALKRILGDTLMGDQDRIKTGLCIVTKRADTFSTWPIINHPDGKYYESNKDLPLWEVVRASTAAPTYFLPVIFKVGDEEKGAFIDGGISMFNNPSLQLFLIATLRGFPFHWSMGTNNILLVSCGTGAINHIYEVKDMKNPSLMTWASLLPEHFLSDANHYNQLILQMLSDSPTAMEIDSEVGDLKHDRLNGQHVLSYLRFNVQLDPESLNKLGFSVDRKKAIAISKMDNPKNISILAEIGERHADQLLTPKLFPARFDLSAPADEVIQRFTAGKKHKLPFEAVVKKPVVVKAVKIDQPFEVESMEGVMTGKPGDYLMQGVNGEYYVCDQAIFRKTYKKADPS